MSAFFRSWRSIRWLAFLAALALDGYIFYLTEPFTPLSFMASGIGAVLLFAIFLEIALHMRGAGRIKASLDEDDKKVYEVGRHFFDLLRRIRKSPLAHMAIWLPVNIAVLSFIGTCFLMWQSLLLGGPDPWHVAAFAYAGFLPLLLAIPFVLEHVAEWASYRYILVIDTKSHDPRLLVHHGVLEYDLETVSLERTVTIHLHQTFFETLVGIGDVELRETAGGSGERLESVWRPRLLVKQMQRALRRKRQDGPRDED